MGLPWKPEGSRTEALSGRAVRVAETERGHCLEGGRVCGGTVQQVGGVLLETGRGHVAVPVILQVVVCVAGRAEQYCGGGRRPRRLLAWGRHSPAITGS